MAAVALRKKVARNGSAKGRKPPRTTQRAPNGTKRTSVADNAAGGQTGVETEQTTSLASLKPDPANCRKHNPRNIGSIVNSLHNVGAARSIVIDEDNVILAGNGLVEAAGEAGIERVRVVEADGNTIIAVRRTGLTAKQKAQLAIADNRTAELAEWDAEQLLATIAEHEIDLSSVEFSEEDLARLSAPTADQWGQAMDNVPSGDRAPFQQMTFTLSDDQAVEVKGAMEEARKAGPFVDTGNENGNGNALARICEAYRGRG